MHQFDTDPPRLEDVDDLDAGTVVAGAEALVRRRRGIEADELRLVARWADLHSAEPPPGTSRAQQRFGDRLINVGGPGAPRVQEFCLAELAVARNQHPLGMRQTMADVLDLKHRLPRCWDRVQALASDAWVACRVARLTHHLSAAQAEVVDLAVADMLGVQAPSRVFTVVEATINEADPDRYAAEIEAEATRRCVKVSQSNPRSAHHLRPPRGRRRHLGRGHGRPRRHHPARARRTRQPRRAARHRLRVARSPRRAARPAPRAPSPCPNAPAL